MIDSEDIWREVMEGKKPTKGKLLNEQFDYDLSGESDYSSGKYVVDRDFSDWESDWADESINAEDGVDKELYEDYERDVQQGGNDRDIQWLRAILARLRKLKEKGEEDGIDEKILEVEQTL